MIEPKEIFHFTKNDFKNFEGSNFLDFIIPKDFPYFEGHFPNNPIVPAIAFIDLSENILFKILDPKKVKIEKIKKAKFTEVILPQDKIRIIFNSETPSDWTFTIYKNELIKAAMIKLSISTF